MSLLKLFTVLLCSLVFCGTLNAGDISAERKDLGKSINLNQQEIDWINKHKSVSVAVKTGWMPIEFKLENESSRGISMDYLNEISLLTGIKFVLTDINDYLHNSNVQMLSAISGTQNINHFYKSEPPYLSISYAAYINKNAKSYTRNSTFDDLGKAKIAYFKNAELGKKLRDKFPEAQLIQVDIADEAFEYLRHKQVDAYIGSEIVIDYHIRFHRLAFAEKLTLTPFKVDVYMAVHEDQPILNSIIGKAIKQIGTNNEDILNYWDPRNLLSNEEIKLIALVLLLLLSGFTYWFYSNRKNVRRLKEEQSRAVWRQAHYDTQTNIPNRHYFEIKLNEQIVEASFNDSSFSLIYIDLDNFKDINDRSGHVVGDKFLKEVASRLNNFAGKYSFLARIGGDEFAIIVSDLQTKNNIDALCEKIVKSIANPMLIDDTLYSLSCSIGISVYPNDTTDDILLLSYADQAMYEAKANGKNQHHHFKPEINGKKLEKISLLEDLKEALRTNQFKLVYQPILQTIDLKVVKLEALIRWHHPVKGVIPPDRFISLAEDSGLIHELGKWIFSQVINDIVYLKNVYSENLTIAINVSPLQFNKNEYFEEFLNKLYFNHISTSEVCFEITEGVLLDANIDMMQTMSKLKNQGIKFSIDDFGTGYSALGYLKKYDIDYIKIDKSFIYDIVTNSYNKILCESIISMAHKLNIKLIAEGIETKEQQNVLKSFGCDYLQGYLFERPISIEDFVKKYSHSKNDSEKY